MSCPDGYHIIPIYRGVAGSGSSLVFMTGMTITDGVLTISARNMNTSAASGLIFYVYIIIIPDILS